MRKAFDIKAAQAGAKVVTRDGRPVEIFKYNYREKEVLKIAYCCTDEDGNNHAYLVNQAGVFMEAKESDQDLFIDEEIKYRPYSNAEEIDEAIKGHGMFVKHRSGGRFVITSYDEKNVSVGGRVPIQYETLLEHYVWLDGTPCGIMEGGDNE